MSDGKLHSRSIGLVTLLTMVLFLSAACTNPDKTVEKKFAQAQEQLEAGQTEEAIGLLEELNQTYPDRLDVVEFLAFTHARNNNPRKAAEFFSEAARLAPDRSDLLLFAAQALEEAGDLDAASSHYRLYIVDNFNDFSGWRALAEVEEQRGRHRDAIDAYLNVYRIRPGDTAAVALGNLFLQLNNTAQAHHWYRTALEKRGEAAPQALLGLLRINLEEENWTRAQELITELDTRYPGQLDRTELAEARNELRRWREAREELERLRQEQVAQEQQREQERLAREEEERLAQIQAREEAERAEREALAQPQQAEREEPESDSPPETEIVQQASPYNDLLASARSRAAAGRRGEAIALYWEALTQQDDDATVWFELSRLQYQREDFQDAELTALEALRRDPQRESFHLHYLNVIRETHPVRAYLRELERAQDNFPHNAEIALALANTHARSFHSHAEAVRYYRLFLQLAPRDPRRQEVEATLRQLAR
jgi:tetratricopeptide (TPR) repeat protein